MSISSHIPKAAIHRRWSVTGLLFVLAAATLAIGLLSLSPRAASAAAPPITQCNNDTASNVGGQGIACTVTIVNYVTSTGAIDATSPSTVTVTKCTGAAGPIAAGAGTCATTTTTSTAPITLVQQCDGSANGGGGVAICTVTVTNHFSGSPAVAPAAAAVYQCIGSVISGPGAPGNCTPVNTPGITSVTAATVGQCNNSGNGGTSVGFICTVGGSSTTTSTLAVHVDQCNGSGNGGGSLVRCTAAVMNDVVAAIPTPTATVTPPSAPTVVPTAVPTPTVTPPVVAAPTIAPTPAVVPPVVATPVAPPTSTLRPPATGNAGLIAQRRTTHLPQWLVGVAIVVLLLTAVRSLGRRRAITVPARLETGRDDNTHRSESGR